MVSLYNQPADEGEIPYAGFCCPVCHEPVQLRELIVEGRELTPADLMACCANCGRAWSFAEWRQFFPHRAYFGPVHDMEW